MLRWIDQGAGDPLYQPMAGHFDTSAAYKAALDLVLKGLEQPSGYTEQLLHAWRLKSRSGRSDQTGVTPSFVDLAKRAHKRYELHSC